MDNSSPNRKEHHKQGNYKSEVKLKTRLCEAAGDGRHQEVLNLIQQGATFQPCGAIGQNPLHLAAKNGHLEVCKVLLRFKILIDTQDRVDKTALHLAANNGHTEIVELLLSKEATVDIDDMLRMTPLHWACEGGHYQVAELLLANGADPDRLNKFKKSPRYIAGEKKHSGIVKLMEDTRNSCPPESEAKKEAANVHSKSSNSGMFTNRTCTQSNSEESLPTLSAEVINAEEEEESSQSLEDLMSRSCDLNGDVEDDLQDNLLKTLDELEACSFNNLYLDRERATAELSKVEAALLAIDDPMNELRRAVSLGQTIKLTEAGKLAFSMTVPDPFIIPYEENSKRKARERSPAAAQAQNNECGTVALRSQSISELYNELAEACNIEVPTCRSPSSKRYRR